jgi:HK97 family phage major capsid protein
VARNTYEAWIPEEYDSTVITRVNAVSAVEALARRIPMGSDTKHEPRSAGVGVELVAKGAAYGEDASANDDVLLTARKLGKVIRIADEDINDSLADILAVKRADWATSYAKFLDNSTLGVTAAENGTTVPFTSVYRTVRNNDASTGYTADTNYTATGTGGVTYDALSAFTGLTESSNYWSEGDMILIAHPAFRGVLRGVKDSNGSPIFVQGLAGTPDTLFGSTVRWSLGARTSAVATDSPAGNPLLISANRTLLMLGIRSGPEYRLAGADTGAAFLTDEALLKMRSRRGFVVGHPSGFAVLEKTA